MVNRMRFDAVDIDLVHHGELDPLLLSEAFDRGAFFRSGGGGGGGGRRGSSKYVHTLSIATAHK